MGAGEPGWGAGDGSPIRDRDVAGIRRSADEPGWGRCGPAPGEWHALALADASGDRKLQAAANREVGNLEMLLDPGAATSRLSPWAEVGETYDETSFTRGHSPYSGCRPCFKDASMTPRRLLEDVVGKVARTGSIEGQAHADFHLAELRWREGDGTKRTGWPADP